MGVNKENVKIHVSHLKKNFGKLEVLKDVSMDICEGEVVVILGPSGSGKSTLLRCLNRLEESNGGEVIVDGHDLTDRKTNINKVRETVGMVFQHFNLFNNLDVMGNMMLAPVDLRKATKPEAKERALRLLDRVGLLDKASAYPAQLSGGQKQRVAIAGVIAMAPRCIVLDEPTAMLDPIGRADVLRTIRALNREKGITVVLITHHMDEAAQADRLVVMAKGRVVADGTPRKVFQRVEELKAVGLTVPETTELLWQLRQAGVDVPLDALSDEECAQALFDLLQTRA